MLRIYKVYQSSPEYRAWRHMKSRCYNLNRKNNKNYFGRGIIVCDEWLHNPKAFMDYIGARPSPKYTLDRIDNDGNYEPGNVRWATPTQQIHNRRIRNKYGCNGIRKSSSGNYIASIGNNHKTIYLGTFDTANDAIYARKQAEIKYRY